MRIKILAQNSKILGGIYGRYKEFLIRRKARSVEAFLKSKGAVCVNADSVWFRPRPEQTDCHIIGSGWSLLQSHDLARTPNAFVVGFNQAALMDLKYDVYFTEFAGPGLENLMLQQKKLIIERVKPHTKNVFFKNIWADHNDRHHALQLKDDVIFVKDVIPVALGGDRALRILNFLMEKDSVYIRQFGSTAITCIILAFHSGFKKIILHGVDYGGAYFYDIPEFNCPDNLRPVTAKFFYPKTDKSTGAHMTNRSAFGIKELLPILKHEMSRYGVELVSAIPASPSSRDLESVKL